MACTLSSLQCASWLDSPLHHYFKQNDCLNYFFCFRWILIQFKREFDFHQIMRLWEVFWTHYPSKHLHLYVCVMILKRYRHKIMGELMDFDTLLNFINEQSGDIDLDSILSDAEALSVYAGENGSASIPPSMPPSLPVEVACYILNKTMSCWDATLKHATRVIIVRQKGSIHQTCLAGLGDNSQTIQLDVTAGKGMLPHKCIIPNRLNSWQSRQSCPKTDKECRHHYLLLQAKKGEGDRQTDSCGGHVLSSSRLIINKDGPQEKWRERWRKSWGK